MIAALFTILAICLFVLILSAGFELIFSSTLGTILFVIGIIYFGICVVLVVKK